MTGYRQIEQKFLNKKMEKLHCYKEPEVILGYTHEVYFKGFYNMFAGYRKLGEYCKKNNIRLVNLTEGSMIDSLPMQKLSEII